jgi:hypothetical protein
MSSVKTYSEKLKDPRWQKKRLEVLQRDNFTCLLCGDNETELHVHHKEYLNGHQPWGYELTNFATYCKHCHSAVEYISARHQYEFVKGNKRITGIEDIVMLLILLVKDGKPHVAVVSFDHNNDLELHIIMGPKTITDIVTLRDLIPQL